MNSTAGDPISGSGYYPVGSLLERWSESVWENGIQIERLRDMQTLKVRTMNSLYEFTIISATEGLVLVRGGLHFPEWPSVGLSGSPFGGSFIKSKGIYVGFCMEFNLGEMRIFTTSLVH